MKQFAEFIRGHYQTIIIVTVIVGLLLGLWTTAPGKAVQRYSQALTFLMILFISFTITPRQFGLVVRQPVAVLFGVANPAQEKRILDYLYQVGIAEPYPVRVLHPPIYPGSKDWREYYRNNNLNLPDQYHNGGIWPFVGGFYVAVLVKMGQLDEARRQLEKLAEVNSLGINGEWEFNEWCHGRTGRPMGYPHQAWSAGMYVYAYHCVAEGRVPVFDTEDGW